MTGGVQGTDLSKLHSTSDTPLFAEWVWSGCATPRGVALCIHGLNCRPEKMLAVARLLASERFDTLNVSLRGHGENIGGASDGDDMVRLDAFRGVTSGLWLQEAQQAHCAAADRARALGVPLLLAGYSLGGLVVATLVGSLADPEPADGLILFAPALSVKPPTYALRLLAAFPKLVIPSFSPKEYAANRGTPIAAYNALFDLIREARVQREQGGRASRTPALLFIDPKDELVSFRGLQRICSGPAAPPWRLVPIGRPLQRSRPDYHHLIIDPNIVGSAIWRQVSEEVRHFLISSNVVAACSG